MGQWNNVHKKLDILNKATDMEVIELWDQLKW